MTEKYSYRRRVAILIALAALGWFAFIGFVVSAVALVNVIKEWW